MTKSPVNRLFKIEILIPDAANSMAEPHAIDLVLFFGLFVVILDVSSRETEKIYGLSSSLACPPCFSNLNPCLYFPMVLLFIFSFFSVILLRFCLFYCDV